MNTASVVSRDNGMHSLKASFCLIPHDKTDAQSVNASKVALAWHVTSLVIKNHSACLSASIQFMTRSASSAGSNALDSYA